MNSALRFLAALGMTKNADIVTCKFVLDEFAAPENRYGQHITLIKQTQPEHKKSRLENFVQRSIFTLL